MIDWIEDRVISFDFETSGRLEEFALQPWRVAAGDAWLTSMSIIRWKDNRLVPDGSKLFPDRQDVRNFVVRVIAADWYVVGWNVSFDIAWLIAYGCGDLVHKIKWIDGMLLLKHLAVEPEYELDRAKKRSYGLKAAVEEFIPVAAGYADDVDFHSTEPEELAKLQKYNDRDSVYTWIISKMVWDELAPEQRRAAMIEAECLSLVAEANLEGMLVDGLVAHEL
jgi:hypothetical protein